MGGRGFDGLCGGQELRSLATESGERPWVNRGEAHCTKHNPHLNSPGVSRLLCYPRKLFLIHFFLESAVRTLLLNNAKTKTKTPLLAGSAESGVLGAVQLPRPETMELHFFMGI